MSILDRFVALHLETTGTDPQSDDIIEVAAVRVEAGEIADEFRRLVRPRRGIPPAIERLTGIRAADVARQGRAEDVLPDLLAFIDDLPIVAHNADFAAGFLLAVRPGISLPPLYDTLDLARIAIPRLRNHRLETLLEAFGILVEETRAQADLRAFVAVFHCLVDSLAARPIGRLEALVILAQDARAPDPPVGSIADLLREIVALGARRGLEGVPAPKIAEDLLVSLPNTLGAFGSERLEPSADVVPVEPDAVRCYLGPRGPLARALEHYEERPSQVEMAAAVCGAFGGGEILVCEAGTGTGKSLAYLAPAILWAVVNARRVVVSTNTKTLQEQLFYKDLPLLAATLGVPFRAVLLKGRSNYICLNRWRSGKVPGHQITTDRERLSALPIATWIAETTSGDISENTAFAPSGPGRSLWARLSTEGQPCTPNACPVYNECFLMRVRRAAQQAHVVVVNHSLLFSDLAADNLVLGPYQDLVIDEAHNLERVASQYLGAEVSWWSLRDVAHRIHYREAHESGLLKRVNDALGQSTMPRAEVKTHQTQVTRAIEATAALVHAGQAFFERLGDVLARPTESRFAHKARYTAEENPLAAAKDKRDDLRAAIASLAAELGTLADWLRDLDQGRLGPRDEFVVDLENRGADLAALDDIIMNLTEAADETLVYWYELPADALGRHDVRLYAAPLHVGERLRERFFPGLRSVVMTSATLAVAGKFTYFLDRVGLVGDAAERVRTLAVGSPFDYDRQVLVAVPGWFPNPKSREFQDAVTTLVRDAILRTRRGTLVLFTSYQQLNQTYRAVRADLTAAGILLLGQGLDGSRTNLADLFRRERESVLFGTESFWQGVDVPGEALEMLIIVKLPFAVPTEPLLVAQAEDLRKAGKDPFLHMTVPEAAIRFRQGFGRLIRSQQDRGAVLILDTRVTTERFGRAFLLSLPTKHRLFKTPESLLAALDRFFDGRDSSYADDIARGDGSARTA